MHYVQLANDVIILNTSIGVSTISKYTFNFNKILALLKSNSSEEAVLPLLKPLETPEGIYFAYLDPCKNKIYLNHKQHGTETITVLGADVMETYTLLEEDFLGTYISIESVYEDWPEYAL